MDKTYPYLRGNGFMGLWHLLDNKREMVMERCKERKFEIIFGSSCEHDFLMKSDG